MIIADKWRPIANWRIELTPWLRAPLYLSNGVRLFAAIDSETACRRYPEIVITDIDPHYWSDLWRIEIDIVDSVGSTHMLLDLLAQRRVEVIRSEGSVNSFNNNYTMSVVACARQYEGNGDGSTRDRMSARMTRLRALEAEILIYFGDQIAIDDDGRPRIKLTRMTSYLSLQEEINAGHRKLLSPGGFLLERNSFTFASSASKRSLKEVLDATSGRAPGNRESLLDHSDVLYTAAVDTKSRLLRLLLCREGSSGLHHMQAYLPASSTALAHLFGVLKKAGGNVLRYQLRPMPEGTTAKHFGADRSAHKLDMTFEFKTSKAEKVSQRLEAISTGLANLHHRQGGPIIVNWNSWSAADVEIRDKASNPTEKRVRKSARANIKPKQKSAGRSKSRSASNRRGAPKGGAESV